MRVHHLGCGTMCPFGGRLLGGEGGPWNPGRLVCHVLLVETDRDGLALVDTGMGLDDIAAPAARLGRPFVALTRPVLREEETAVRRVEALGFSARDVRHVILTHMDLDHAGGLGDFPDATVHVLEAEHRAAVDRPTAAERNRYRPAQWAHAPTFATYAPKGEPWHGFACVRDLEGLPPEILLVPLSGHSRGHAGVAVESENGWLLHAGDAYFHAAQMRERASCPPLLTLFQNVVAVDRGAMRANQARLRELALDASAGVHVFSAHDPSELEARQRGAALSTGSRDSLRA